MDGLNIEAGGLKTEMGVYVFVSYRIRNNAVKFWHSGLYSLCDMTKIYRLGLYTSDLEYALTSKA